VVSASGVQRALRAGGQEKRQSPLIPPGEQTADGIPLASSAKVNTKKSGKTLFRLRRVPKPCRRRRRSPDTVSVQNKPHFQICVSMDRISLKARSKSVSESVQVRGQIIQVVEDNWLSADGAIFFQSDHCGCIKAFSCVSRPLSQRLIQLCWDFRAKYIECVDS